MKTYFSNILPRLRKYSQDLDRQEIFIDQPWVFIDNTGNQEKYIFKRGGRLIMSLNGDVTNGTWEYLSAAQSLLINRIDDSILLNQVFIEKGIMILKKDGLKEDFVILGNELLIPDMNVMSYLKDILDTKEGIKYEKLKDGRVLEILNHDSFRKKVMIDGQEIFESEVELLNGEKWEISSSVVVAVWIYKDYETNKGKVTICERNNLGPSEGDFVFQDGQIANNGTYRFGMFDRMVVKEGRISRYKLFW